MAKPKDTREVVYVEHPVTPEHKKELRNKGLKIIDAKYAPKDAKVEKSRALKPKAKTKPKAIG